MTSAAPVSISLVSALLIGVLMVMASPARVAAQGGDEYTVQSTVESPLTPTALQRASEESPSVTSTLTLTPTPSPMPTETATPDLVAAALQVSPLRIAPNDRPIDSRDALLWIALAALIALAGAIVMMVAQQREKRR